jgi:hypothetical protein
MIWNERVFFPHYADVSSVSFEILNALNTEIWSSEIYLHAAMVHCYQRLIGVCCLHLQGRIRFFFPERSLNYNEILCFSIILSYCPYRSHAISHRCCTAIIDALNSYSSSSSFYLGPLLLELMQCHDLRGFLKWWSLAGGRTKSSPRQLWPLRFGLLA